MLPKVATHILHSTVTRSAAAAVQNQSNLRNVLQKPGSSSSSSSQAASAFHTSSLLSATANAAALAAAASSSSSSALSTTKTKANPHGGRKDKAGHRFYTGYNGAARAVTQANALTSQDAPTVQFDESDDMHPQSRRALLKKAASPPKRTRLRSSSVNSLLSRDLDKNKERASLAGEPVSVLKTVQLQARSFHALTVAQQQSQAPSSIGSGEEAVADPTVAPTPVATSEQAVEVEEASSTEVQSRSPSPARPRRNSTSSASSIPSSPSLRPAEIPTSPSVITLETATELSSSQNEDSVTRSATPTSPSPSSSISDVDSVATSAPSTKYSDTGLSHFGWKVRDAKEANDAVATTNIVKAMIAHPDDSTIDIWISDYNLAFEALGLTRTEGEPLTLTLQLYNSMLQRSVHPNFRTYLLLIDQFTTRDWEVSRIVQSFLRRNSGSLKAKAHLEQLQQENNFSSALKLFEAIIAIGGNLRLDFGTYKKLMRSCAINANVNAALSVLTYVEKRNQFPDPDLYRYLMQAFVNSNDYKGAELVFQKYRQKEELGELYCNDNNVQMFTRMQVQVWNQMVDVHFRKQEPEKAIELLDVMLKAAAESGEGPVSPKSIPAPTNATFTTVIKGFLQTGDMASALRWFNRLLEQKDVPGDDPFVALHKGLPSRPDQMACNMMIEALANENRVDDMNKIFLRTMSFVVYQGAKPLVLETNLRSLAEVSKEVGLERLAFIQDVFLSRGAWDHLKHRAAYEVSQRYVDYGHLEEAVGLVEGVVNAQLERIGGTKGMGLVEQLQNLVLSVVEGTSARMAAGGGVEWSFESALALARVGRESLGLGVSPEQGVWLLHLYGKARRVGVLNAEELDQAAWGILLKAAVDLESGLVVNVPDFAFQGVASLLEDIAANQVEFSDELCDWETRKAAVDLAGQGRPVEWNRTFFSQLGESYLQAYELGVKTKFEELQGKLEQVEVVADRTHSLSPLSSSTPTKSFSNSFTQFGELSRAIDTVLKNHKLTPDQKADQAYALFEESLAKGTSVPHVMTLGRLIQACGRTNQIERVRELYRVGQALVASLKGVMTESKRWQSWVSLEDNMIIGLAHAGDLDSAHAHRRRILDFAREVRQPLTPSPDAYGALILHVKDTTDDATNSLMLWNEAVQNGVQPNLYLYNNIISKLARARKVDQALELFRQMRAAAIVPSSITYGAIIGACVRVGDAASAETLFKEMMEQGNFKPRVPPFNTMMQMYTTTRPDRARAVWYYEEMLRLGVAPTAHTYKLLLDVYGSVDSVDTEALQTVWKQLTSSPNVRVNGTHFASLINAYGCVLKDLDRATEIFESVMTEHGMARDAVVYEAFVNALVANKRTDLVREYMERMMADGVHMTAYVANFLIKGYANVGDVEQARVIFESMVDPPTGVAAPNNHAPHDVVEGSAVVGVLDPVYREPSTWEAMIRGELGAGNRDRAYALLDRLRARQFPEAVFNRISGVMIDHSTPSLNL